MRLVSVKTVEAGMRVLAASEGLDDADTLSTRCGLRELRYACKAMHLSTAAGMGRRGSFTLHSSVCHCMHCESTSKKHLKKHIVLISC